MSRLNEKWNGKETFELMGEFSHRPFQKGGGNDDVAMWLLIVGLLRAFESVALS